MNERGSFLAGLFAGAVVGGSFIAAVLRHDFKETYDAGYTQGRNDEIFDGIVDRFWDSYGAKTDPQDPSQ